MDTIQNIVSWLIIQSLLEQKDFFCIDTSKNRIITGSICLHGNGKGNTPSKPYFSNKINSHCSSLGKYKIVGAYWMKYYGIPVLKLQGLDKTNSNAKKEPYMFILQLHQ